MSFVEERSNYVLFELDSSTTSNSFGLIENDFLLEAIGKCKNSKKPLLMLAKGKVFCSGGNVKEYAELKNAEEGILINKKIRYTLNQLYSLPVATAVVVEGKCLGGGLELISCFDHIVSSEESVFFFWQRRIGLTFGWGGQKRLADRIGVTKTRNLLLQAENLTAKEAFKLGLVDSLVSESSDVLLMVEKWLEKQSKLSEAPIKYIKENLFFEESGLVGNKNEEELFDALWWNEDHQRALEKFRKD